MNEGWDWVWDHCQNEGREAFAENRPRLAYLLNWAEPSSRLLNIGVGDGTLEELALTRGLEVFSLDPSERAIEGLRQRLGLGDRARSGYSQEIPFPDQSFDIVVISEVLEHLPDDVIQKTLDEIKRVLVHTGRVIGSVPANEDLSAEEVVCPECRHRFHRWGHRQSFGVARITSLLQTRFVVKRMLVRPFFSWRRLNWKGRGVALLKGVLARAGCHGANESICFMAVRP